jgi:hypothetical protein
MRRRMPRDGGVKGLHFYRVPQKVSPIRHSPLLDSSAVRKPVLQFVVGRALGTRIGFLLLVFVTVTGIVAHMAHASGRWRDRGRDAYLLRAPPAEPIQSGFNLLNALESGFHGHSGSDEFALHVTEQIARLVPLIDGEFSRG